VSEYFINGTSTQLGYTVPLVCTSNWRETYGILYCHRWRAVWFINWLILCTLPSQQVNKLSYMC